MVLISKINGETTFSMKFLMQISAIQAFGRKRPVDADDTCTFYQKLYTKQAIQSMLNTDNNYVKQIDLFKN